MKKTLLAVALLLASTCTFAQVGVKQDATKMNKKALPLNYKINEVKPSANSLRNAAKANPSGTTLLCDFSDATAYTVGVTSRHAVTGYGWVVKADTNSATGATLIDNWYGTTQGGYTSYFENPDRANMSAHNGFAYVDLYGAWYDSHLQNNVWESYVKCNTPINAYGKRGIDIYLNQFGQHFNADKYYIDWSNDPNFATYDSIEINVKSVDMNANDAYRGTLRVNLPNNTLHAHAVGTTATELTYVRVRFYCQAISYNQPQGYCWVIDDIAWGEAPAARLDIVNKHFYSGYHTIPQGIQPDTLIYEIALANTGTDSLANVIVKNNLNTATYNTSDSSYTYSFIRANQSTPENLTTATYLDTTTSSSHTITSIDIRRHHYIDAASTVLPTTNIGTYAVTSEITYTDVATNEAGNQEINDTLYYNVLGDSAIVSNPGDYRWAKDRNILVEDACWAKGMVTESDGETYISDNANFSTAGYKVCVGYEASAIPSTPLYIKGVEVVPGLDTCSEGVTIKASLKEWQPGVTDGDAAIINVTDANGNAVESNPYTTSAADLNNGLCTDPYYLDAIYSDQFHTIYMPFINNNVVLNANTIYYACYELVNNGRFAVGQDYSYKTFRRFGSGLGQMTLVFSPGVAQDQLQSWGGNFYYPNWTDYCAPMIRLYVSTKASGLNDANAQTAANMNMYPNPAVNTTSVNYTLNQSGNVTLKVTDLMGRTVLTMNEGNQNAGISYKANVDVSSLNNGTYFCTLYVNGAKSTSKFVVNR
jgi:hypothetical protein